MFYCHKHITGTPRIEIELHKITRMAMQAYAVFIFLSVSHLLEHSLHKHILIVFCKS